MGSTMGNNRVRKGEVYGAGGVVSRAHKRRNETAPQHAENVWQVKKKREQRQREEKGGGGEPQEREGGGP